MQEIDRKTNNISQQAEDVIRRMLVVDPEKRISWEDLFNHKINFYQEEKLNKDLENTLKGGDMMISMSKFYIKNNMVIDHPAEIKKKEDLNNFAVNVVKKASTDQDTKEQKYDGILIRRPQEEALLQRQDLQKQQSTASMSIVESVLGQEEYKSQPQPQNDAVSDKETQREIEIRSKKRNSNRILHERNICVFIASVAEEVNNNSEIVGFLLIKKLLQMIDFLRNIMLQKQNYFQLDLWEQFVVTKDFKDIYTYIQKEYDVFKVYFDSILDKLIWSPKVKSGIDDQIKQVINRDYTQNIDGILRRVLLDYCKSFVGGFMLDKQIEPEQLRGKLTHSDRVLDCLNMKEAFLFENSKGEQFNFKQYYEEDNKIDIEVLQQKVLQKLHNMK